LVAAEAPRSDVGLGRARLDEVTRRFLGVDIGESIEIIGGRSTVATALEAPKEDEGMKAIRIDGLVRQNAKVALGGNVTVRRADVRAAQEIVFAFVIKRGHKMSFGQGIENFVKRGLLKRPLIKGDTVIVPGIALLGAALPLTAIRTKPDGIVRILNETEITLREEPFYEIDGLTSDELYRAFVDRLAERLSETVEEFERRIDGMEGHAGEKARLLARRVRDLLKDLQRE